MSDAMRKLQIKIGGCGSDGAFGPNTARAIANFYGLSGRSRTGAGVSRKWGF